MIRKSLSKLSGAFLKAHRFIDSYLKMGRKFRPYTLKYPEKRGEKKIVHFIGNFIVGGSTQLVVDIIERTSDEYSHKVVVPSLERRLAYQPVDIHAFPIGKLSELAEWLKNENPELVHIHYFVRSADKYSQTALWYETVFKICEDLRVRVIQNVNVPTHPFPSSSVIHNIFVSQYVEKAFNNVTAESSVIYPGSDFTHFRNNEIDFHRTKSIGMVYRLDDDKIRSDAIEIFIRVSKKDPEVISYIVGGGYFLADFKKRVKEEGLEKQIYLSGFVSYDKLPEMYRKFNIFVAPVHDESFGQVTPFAMSMGLCVTGYDTGAISEILGTNDTLVSTGDIDELVATIIELLNDEERRKNLSYANLVRAHDKFSVETMITSYQSLYHRTINDGI